MTVHQDRAADADGRPDRDPPAVRDALSLHHGKVRARARHGEDVRHGYLCELRPVAVHSRPTGEMSLRAGSAIILSTPLASRRSPAASRSSGALAAASATTERASSPRPEDHEDIGSARSTVSEFEEGGPWSRPYRPRGPTCTPSARRRPCANASCGRCRDSSRRLPRPGRVPRPWRSPPSALGPVVDRHREGPRSLTSLAASSRSSFVISLARQPASARAPRPSAVASRGSHQRSGGTVEIASSIVERPLLHLEEAVLVERLHALALERSSSSSAVLSEPSC